MIDGPSCGARAGHGLRALSRRGGGGEGRGEEASRSERKEKGGGVEWPRGCLWKRHEVRSTATEASMSRRQFQGTRGASAIGRRVAEAGYYGVVGREG